MEIEITKTQEQKLKDISKYYVSLIKTKKDIEKYITDSKQLEILSIDKVGIVGNIRTEKEQKELEQFFGYELENTCKVITIKILDNINGLRKIKDTDTITIYYNNYEDIKDYDKDNFNEEMMNLGYKQIIYRILY